MTSEVRNQKWVVDRGDPNGSGRVQVYGIYTDGRRRECIRCGDLTDEYSGLQDTTGRWIYRHPSHLLAQECEIIRDSKRARPRVQATQVARARERQAQHRAQLQGKLG